MSTISTAKVPFMISGSQTVNDYDLRNADDLYIPPTRTSVTEKLLYFALPKCGRNHLHGQKCTPKPDTYSTD
jgi:hypothetical protein